MNGSTPPTAHTPSLHGGQGCKVAVCKRTVRLSVRHVVWLYVVVQRRRFGLEKCSQFSATNRQTDRSYVFPILHQSITDIQVCCSVYRLIHRTQQSPAGAVAFVWVLMVDLLPDGMRRRDEEWAGALLGAGGGSREMASGTGQ